MRSEHTLSADWLRLREPFDFGVRSSGLVADLRGALPPDRKRILDLGCGLGTNLRFLAPRLGGEQHWTLVDNDVALLRAIPGELISWATARELPCHLQDQRMLISQWRIDRLERDLRAGLGSLQTDCVVTTALLDRVSLDFLQTLADWLESQRVPLLASMTVDGRIDLSPGHPHDGAVLQLFRDHQTRDHGPDSTTGPAAGPEAAEALAGMVMGFNVSMESTDWIVGRPDQDMLRDRVNTIALAAESMTDDAAMVAAWREERLAQIAQKRLDMRIGHQDILLLPQHTTHPIA